MRNSGDLIERKAVLEEVASQCRLHEKQRPPVHVQLEALKKITRTCMYDYGDCLTQGASQALRECRNSLESSNELDWVLQEIEKYKEAEEYLVW